jgi:Flp pilus assembly pilin Flp
VAFEQKGEVKYMWNDVSRLFAKLVARVSIMREEGQAMVEYSLIVATISIAAVAVFTPLGTAISNAFNTALKAF